MMSKSYRVLVVDHRHKRCRALAERLRHRGMRIATASNGDVALDQLSMTDFAAVVLELARPIAQGLEELKHLLEQDPDLQVIVVTGQRSRDKGVAAMTFGAADYIQRPVHIDDLIAKIEHARHRRRLCPQQERMDRHCSS